MASGVHSASHMMIGPLIGLAGNLLQSVFGSHGGSASGIEAAASTAAANSATPFAEILGSLQQPHKLSTAASVLHALPHR